MTIAAVPIAPDGERRIEAAPPIDLRRTLGIHRRGPRDPALRFEASGSAWRATRTPDGPVTLFIEARDGTVRARAWGPGTAWALARVDGLLGLDDRPEALVPQHRAVDAAVRRLRGLRIGRTGAVLEALVPAILEQKVLGGEARRAWVGPRPALRRGRARAAGHAPPAGAPHVSRRLPYYAYHPFGVERRRADLIRAVARDAARLERLVDDASGPSGDPARGLRAAAGDPGDRPVDGGRGRDPCVRRRRRGERRRLPPAEHRRLGARRRAAGRRTSGCWSCSSPIAATAAACCGCSSCRASARRRRAPTALAQRFDRF